jgi:tetratricopeptide (TPR) repeat protein
LNQGKFAESLSLFETALEINPQSDVAYNSLGINYSKLGDHTRSIEMFKKAIDHNPCFSLAYINLSFEYIDFHNYQEAFKCLKKGKEIVDTSDRDVFSNCNGFILDQLELFENEMEEWEMKIRLGYLTDEDKQKIQMLRTGFENRFQSIFNLNDEGKLSVTLSDLNP